MKRLGSIQNLDNIENTKERNEENNEIVFNENIEILRNENMELKTMNHSTKIAQLKKKIMKKLERIVILGH